MLIFDCKAKLTVKTADNTEVYQSSAVKELNGDVFRSFAASETKQLLLLFEDLSVHYVQNERKLWQREEALS